MEKTTEILLEWLCQARCHVAHTWEYEKRIQNFSQKAWNEETTCGIWYRWDGDVRLAPKEGMWYYEVVITRWIYGLVADCCEHS
jgi:hypothetical protein